MYKNIYEIVEHDYDDYLLKIKNLNDVIKKIDNEISYYVNKNNNLIIKEEERKIHEINTRIDFLQSLMIIDKTN